MRGRNRNLDQLDRAYATAVREVSTGAGGVADEKGHPHWGAPFGMGVVTGAGLRCV
jgi:hypothetical protein